MPGLLTMRQSMLHLEKASDIPVRDLIFGLRSAPLSFPPGCPYRCEAWHSRGGL